MNIFNVKCFCIGKFFTLEKISNESHKSIIESKNHNDNNTPTISIHINKDTTLFQK